MCKNKIVFFSDGLETLKVMVIGYFAKEVICKVIEVIGLHKKGSTDDSSRSRLQTDSMYEVADDESLKPGMILAIPIPA